MNTANYTDLLVINDRLIASVTNKDCDGHENVLKQFTVISPTSAVGTDNKAYKLNRRGNKAALFVGNHKVLARV